MKKQNYFCEFIVGSNVINRNSGLCSSMFNVRNLWSRCYTHIEWRAFMDESPIAHGNIF